MRERAVSSGNQHGLQTRAGEARARNGAAVSARFGGAEVIGGAFVARPVHSRFIARVLVSRGFGRSAECRGEEFPARNRIAFGSAPRPTTRPRKVLIYIALPALESACHMRVTKQQPAGGDVSISLPLRSSVFVSEGSEPPRMA